MPGPTGKKPGGNDKGASFFDRLLGRGKEADTSDEFLAPPDKAEKPNDLTLRDEKAGPQQEMRQAAFTAASSNKQVIAYGPPEELSPNQELVRKTLMEELDAELDNTLDHEPEFKNNLIKSIPGLKNIKPRPSFRYDEFDPKEQAKYVYVFEYEDGLDVYLHRDGSLSCYVDPSKSQAEQDEDAIKGISRMLEVAASMNMRQGMLCLPPGTSDRLRERLNEVVKNARENLGIEVFIGNPSIPTPPKQGTAPRPSPYG